MNKFVLVGLSSLIGCGISQEKFEEDYRDVMCERSLECAPEAAEILGWSDASDCVAFFNDPENASEEECVYDASFAQICLDETKAMSCEDYTEASFPASCSNVCGE